MSKIGSMLDENFPIHYLEPFTGRKVGEGVQQCFTDRRTTQTSTHTREVVTTNKDYVH